MLKNQNSENKPDTVIKLSGVSKIYNLYNSRQDRLKEALHPRRKKYHREFYALNDINLEVKRGEVLGIVGKNGSGKSTLLKIISGILTPSAGTVEVKGKVVALLELGAGFNPEFTGMENIYFYCALLGYTRKETEALVPGIVDFAELNDFIHQPIKTYSSGMKARLGFSVAINVDPEILILDEVLAVGDELFRRKCYARMEEFFKGGKTILFVSHDSNSINQLCSRCILLDRGASILEGPPKLVITYYQKMLYAIRERESDVRREIILLNKDTNLKIELYEQLSGNKENEFNKKEIIPVEDNSMEKTFIDNNLVITSSLKKTSLTKAYYIPNFLPKTTLEYRNYNVDITNIQITSLSGHKVNVLISEEEYIFEYVAVFNIDVEHVSFGMTIVNEKGIAISGLTTKEYLQINNIYSGEQYKISWHFNCIMLKGNYYIYAGIKGSVNGNYDVVNRIIDAMVFKVIEPVKRIEVGLVSLDQKIKITKL